MMELSPQQRSVLSRRNSPLLALVLLALSFSTCKKVPLQMSSGAISYASYHWFENEQTAYVFFEINENPERLIEPKLEIALNTSNQTAASQPASKIAVDFSKGVHEHALVACGAKNYCGSFSFKSVQAPPDGQLIFYYDPNSQLTLTKDVSLVVHAAGETADSYSALAYGIFDATNSRVQVRIHDHFGDPNSTDLSRYGMRRKFRASSPVLSEIASANIESAATGSATPLIFPANALCASGNEAMTAPVFAGNLKWLKEAVDGNQDANAACFSVAFMDKNDAALIAAPIAGLARRNPILVEPTLELNTPLKTMTQIPIQIGICEDEPFAGNMIDEQFLTYQRFILGVTATTFDLCFRTAQTTQFKSDFSTLLSSKLSEARQASTGGNDFVFVVLYHHIFSENFRDIHRIIAGALHALAASESNRVSPRMVGSFVYESAADFRPTGEQQKTVIWCPQQLADEIIGSKNPLANQNCTTTPAFELNLKIINFVAPLGPFPSLESYAKYVDKYGDEGLANSPRLNFQSVPWGENSILEKNAQVSFFDGQRFSLSSGEFAKFCYLRDVAALNDFKFRTDVMASEVASIDSISINRLWLSDDNAGSWRIGLTWDFPFWGGIQYSSPLTGKVMNIVPFSRSFNQYQKLGDSKWQTTSWNIGKFIQHCRKYCDNPFFDEAGVYQIQTTWRKNFDFLCPASQPPTAEAF